MGDMGDDFKAYKERKKKIRAKYGIECPQCKKHRPKSHATILLPQQKCKVDGYVDPRPELTGEQYAIE